MLEIADLAKVFPPASGLARLLLRSASDEPVEALAGVDLAVDGGEIVGLVGPNGAGKTTLFRIIATILEPTSGRVVVDGHDVATDPIEVRRRIGLLLEGDRGFYLRLTGRQNLEFFGVMYGLSPADARTRAEEVMALVGLEGRDLRVFGFSSGMRIRLALARVLMAEPPLLLLDEPTRSLDPEASAEFIEMIRELAGRGRAVLMASHRLTEVAAACDRTVLLVDGRVRFAGPTSALLTDEGALRHLDQPPEGRS
jgi:ABC-2 type transport system ATP-binding protein